ncbi:unnamed protein product [Pseudo-nitzschia multistriata]|uniref:RING-type domain-containing protein n=1 Tax=Pseudo-nitzschia multistriata TaxID=183589 RepID=A0A448ZEL7_9STRA|nr:unnamed protein product [Pseudo-nitzschia multistriata]
MGRNSKHRQPQNGSRQQAANELLNFHFSTPATARQHSSSYNSNDYNSRNRRGRNHKHDNHRRSAKHRASVRQTADSSMFHLHSSAEHTFLLTRRSPSRMNTAAGNDYSFHGSDKSVRWDSVRAVRQRVPSNGEDNACPICLCDFVSARISKCGHSFCLPCVLRHAQTYAANNPYHPVKCPCCGVPLVLEDARPVCFEAVRPVVLQQKLRLRKLHRQKTSSSPYLPIREAPMHSNPHFAPTDGIDADARYSRFNYLDPDAYHALLVANQGELEREARELEGSGFGDASPERMYLSIALGMVLAEQQIARSEYKEEASLMARFAEPGSGMYQPQSPALVFLEEEKGKDPNASSGGGGGSCNSAELLQHEIDSGPTENDAGEDGSSCTPQRHRGESISSYKSVDTASSAVSFSLETGEPGDGVAAGRERSTRKKALRKPRAGSMYLDTENAVHLYQAEDGQLVFLNGFNMTCLLSDFSKGPPASPGSPPQPPVRPDGGTPPDHHAPRSTAAGPLPDVVEGKVLEKELVHVTHDTRKRMPFLNHVPLYTDVVFVELDLNHLLSGATRRKFRSETEKRKNKRQSRARAEKRADRMARKEDQERINARKAQLPPVVDPDDCFFQTLQIAPPPPVESEAAEPPGPLPGGEAQSGITAVEFPPQAGPPALDFSRAARRGDLPGRSDEGAFPALSSARAFPALGGASRSPGGARPTASRGWGGGPETGRLGPLAAPGGGKTKKKKAQKLVLFSTGGSRAY